MVTADDSSVAASGGERAEASEATSACSPKVEMPPEVPSIPAIAVPPSSTRASARPQTAKKLYTVEADPKPAAIVIHCSDPRFQAAFEEFAEHELGLAKGNYIPIVVGGGAGVLGHPEQLPKEFKFLKERLEHYRAIFPTARRVILINHEGCRYYDALKSKTLVFLGSRLLPKLDYARQDLTLVERVFRTLLAHLGYSVELYYARFVDPERTRIAIERVGGPAEAPTHA